MKNTNSWCVGVAVVVVMITCAVGVTPSAARGSGADEALSPDGAHDGVVVFYFHGNVRCATCKKIEAYADEAIHSGFSSSLEAGDLEWRVVNIDEDDNRHFVEDFQLVTRSVVLAEFRGGEVVRWENLDKVWQLVRSKDRFVAYVEDATRAFLGTS